PLRPQDQEARRARGRPGRRDGRHPLCAHLPRQSRRHRPASSLRPDDGEGGTARRRSLDTSHRILIIMTLRIPALITLFTLASCGPNLAQEPADAFQARVDSATAATDTARLATLAEARCASLDNEARATCYEDY